MNRNLEKHKKYKLAYKPNDFYWGLGVEHETYIETNKLKQITLRELKEYRDSERYCVDYYSVYNIESLDKALDGLFSEDSKILIPILLNSHTFQKTDLNGEHQMTFERIPKQNPDFLGKTIFEWMKEKDPFFAKEYEGSYIFDGDTIEFMTQNFYKATVDKTIKELERIEDEYINALNLLPKEGILKKYGPFKLAQKNYPFASYLTNLKNNAMFNNGTIHINITLPTQLNQDSEIADFDLFRKQHQNYARAIQWLSPLLVAKYGSIDPLCTSKYNGEKYSSGSQRVAVSRYIGLGTFDTDKMDIGKILTKNTKELEDIDWYLSFHKKADYKFLDKIGMDINFNKHFCHGLEFRVLESIPISDLKDILLILVYLADCALNVEFSNPKKSVIWHRLAENCVHNGKGYFVDVSDQNELCSLFGFKFFSKEPLLCSDLLHEIKKFLEIKYKEGLCAKLMIHGINPDDLKPKQLPLIKENCQEIRPVETSVKPTLETAVITKNKYLWCC